MWAEKRLVAEQFAQAREAISRQMSSWGATGEVLPSGLSGLTAMSAGALGGIQRFGLNEAQVRPAPVWCRCDCREELTMTKDYGASDLGRLFTERHAEAVRDLGRFNLAVLARPVLVSQR